MITIEELRERLKAHIEEKHESQNAFAKRLGIQQGSIFRFIKGETTLALEPALKILEDMGYHLLSSKDYTKERGGAHVDNSIFTEQQALLIEDLKEKLELQAELNGAQKKIIELQNQLFEAKKDQSQEFKKNAEGNTPKPSASTYS